MISFCMQYVKSLINFTSISLLKKLSNVCYNKRLQDFKEAERLIEVNFNIDIFLKYSILELARGAIC